MFVKGFNPHHELHLTILVPQVTNQTQNQTQPPIVMTQMPKPPTAATQGDFKVIPFAELLKATNSTRLHNFLAMGRDPIELPINKSMLVVPAFFGPLTNTRSATIPQYVPRKSQNEIMQLAAADPNLKGNSPCAKISPRLLTVSSQTRKAN